MQECVEKLQRLDVSCKTLHVDVLNMKFFPFALKMDHHKCLDIAFNSVKQFVCAARESGYEIIGFIDAGKQTEETIKKWRQRREQEARSGRRGVPQGASILLGDMFRRLGVTVHYSMVDNDDTLAAYAARNGGLVLSADRDFFRYTGCEDPLTVYETFEIVNGKLKLTPHSNPVSKPGVSSRNVFDYTPETRSYEPTFERIAVDNKYIRGVPSPLLKFLPNPHYTAQKLRQALYARMQRDGECLCVLESYPEWLNNDVSWRLEHVKADCSLDDLLDDPTNALNTIFGHEQKPTGCSWLQWQQHQFSQKMVVFDICVAAQRVSNLTCENKENKTWTLLSLLEMSRSRRHRTK